MKTIKHYIEILLSFLIGILFSVSSNATSYDTEPALDHVLVPSESYNVTIGESPTKHQKLIISLKSAEGEDQHFSFYCRKDNPMLVFRYDAKGLNGEYENWGSDVAIQWYQEGETKARDLFEYLDNDILIVGRTDHNLRTTMKEISSRHEGKFTITVYNNGMNGQITTNVISWTLPFEAAEKISTAIMKMDYGQSCDEATGSNSVSSDVAQEHK